MRPLFFTKPAELRAWLRRHHAAESEVWLGFYKKATGKPSLTYDEALDEALCFGWIDGVRKSISGEAWIQRYTPRTQRSYWSAVNTRHARRLIKAGRMQPAGLAAFEARDAAQTRQYTYERENVAFTPAELRRLKANAAAWRTFAALPPGYKRLSTGYVTQAKRPETRERRLALLISCCAQGRRLPGLPQPRGTRPA